jgi:type IV secretory pathway VirJ component
MNVILAALIATLPLVESPAAKPSPMLAIVVSGDGGWARIDRELTRRLNAGAISVVGVDSLKYFWKRRTPDELAAAMASVIETYTKAWNRSDVVLIGYSRGADVIPFAVNRLPAASRARIRLVALVAPARRTSFEIHISDYFSDSGSAGVVPELQALVKAQRTVCIYGVNEDSTACTAFTATNLIVRPLPGNHHFNGDYERVASAILSEIDR